MSILQDKDLIGQFAESVGIKKLEKEVEDLILSDLESKVLEILQESKKVMRHSKRDYLKTDDVKLAMEKLSIPNMFGYPSTIPYTFEKVPDAQFLWFVKSQNINLKEFAVKPKLYTPFASTTYKIHFEALDGNQPQIAETVQENDFQQYGSMPQQSQQQRIPEQIAEQQIIKVDIQDEKKREEERKEQQRLELLDQQKKMYEQKQKQTQQLTKELDAFKQMFIDSYQKLDKSLLLGDQNEQVEYDTQVRKLLQEMQQSPSLNNIFSSLAKFIEEKNKQIIKSMDQMKKPLTKSQGLLLDLIHSIITNQYYDLDNIGQILIKVVSSIIFREIPDSTPYDETEVLQLKDRAAQVLQLLMLKPQFRQPENKKLIVLLFLNRLFQNQSQQYPQQNVPIEQQQINNIEISGLIMYGGLTSLRKFGPQITKLAIIPHLKSLSDQLVNKMSLYQGTNSRQIIAVQRSFEVLKEICLEVINYMRQNERTDTNGLKDVIDATRMVFGQQLDPHINQFEQSIIQ